MTEEGIGKFDPESERPSERMSDWTKSDEELTVAEKYKGMTDVGELETKRGELISSRGAIINESELAGPFVPDHDRYVEAAKAIDIELEEVNRQISILSSRTTN